MFSFKIEDSGPGLPPPLTDERIRNSVPENGIIKFADDTYVSPDSWESVIYAVGASITAIDAVFKKDTDNAFIAVRPPGHHAGSVTSMGFCLVNNIAIAARYAQQKYGIERGVLSVFDPPSRACRSWERRTRECGLGPGAHRGSRGCLPH